MKKIMFVSNRLNKENKNGANIVSRRNFQNLQDIYGEKNIYFRYINPKKRFETLVNEFFFNRMEAISLIDEKEICNDIENKKIALVFLDTSCYGYLAEIIKKRFENRVKIITFCHDITKFLCESLLNDNQLKIKQSLRLKKKIKNSIENESRCFENSDLIITLNSRDSLLMLKEYNKKASLEIPVTFPSKKLIYKKNKKNTKKFSLLFVGVAGFIPNIQGLKFFIKEVLPYINAELYIVGRGMEEYRNKFKSEKVHIVGTVETLDDYYLDADAVIAPIFLGGGMKVKTGEALMYGKTIFGTTEAFQGYDVDYKKIGGLCNTSSEFIEKINNYISNYDGTKQNSYSKKIFDEKYSYEASKNLFKQILKFV